MDICPNGHGAVGWNYCSECGAKGVERPKRSGCPRCGYAPDFPLKKFCAACGWEFGKPIPTGFFERMWFGIYGFYLKL